MSRSVVIVGAGPVGLATAVLLAADGHQVTVLEKDPQGAPESVSAAWERWARSGVSQFRMLHIMLPKVRGILDAELPAVRDLLEGLGARRFNLVQSISPAIRDRAARPGDERFETLTARRPVLELAFARVAENTPGVCVRRGVAVQGPVTGRPVQDHVPHIRGVRLESGEDLAADLVVDAGGRRSKLCEWVTALGGPPPIEEASDAGFTYYVRHYRSRDGSTPEIAGPLGGEMGTINFAAVPADNGTWTVAITPLAGDKALRGLRRSETWERVARAIPRLAPWVEGEPITDVLPMAGVLDRYRRMVVGGTPVVTGLVPVGDAWACTNPLAGRGFSSGLHHAVVLRDALRACPDDPGRLVETFDAATEKEVTPWYRDQVARDRKRVAEVRALMEGRRPEPPPPGPAAFFKAAQLDPEVARAGLDVFCCLASPPTVMARPGMAARVAACAGESMPPPCGPDRTELLELVG